jgi:putative ABC transport system permease protein
MRLLEALRVAVSGLMANRLRSGLTMLGIVIGVSAVIALVSFGQGFQSFVDSQIQGLGSNLVIVMPATPAGRAATTARPRALTMDDVKAISSPMYITGLTNVSPQFSVTARVAAFGNSLTMQVTGTTPEWQQVRTWNVKDGRFIEDADNATSARVAVIGTTVVTKLLDTVDDPLGQEIRINSIPFRVIGVLETKGGFGNADQVIILPLSTTQKQLASGGARTAQGAYRVNTILATAASDKDMSSVKTQIEHLLTDRHNIQYVGEEDFAVFTQEQILNTVGGVTAMITIFLSIIAGISLLVGGIGVMNIMLVSVTERTREIGLRKAVGARYSDLMLQFLIESVVISVTGGLIGVLLGASVAFIAGLLVPSLSISVTPPAIALAAGVSTAIGVFFGIYPASRAAALNPIEALRYE